MKRIAAQRVEVLAAYLFHGDMGIVADKLQLEYKYVQKIIASLRDRGIMTGSMANGYRYNGTRFRVTGEPVYPELKEPLKKPQKPPSPMKKTIIQMSEEERQWMLANYRTKGRRIAANTLKRTRADICLIALQLGLGS